MKTLNEFQAFACEKWFATENKTVKILIDAVDWVTNDLRYKAPEQLTAKLYVTYIDHLIFAMGEAVGNLHKSDSFIVPSLGLAGESGEVAEKMKKYFRGDDVDLETVKPELGDVLFYLAVLSKRLGFDLSDVAQCEVDKINGRIERGTRRGEGDDR